MSEVTLPMSLPLDSDGFLRRECPLCERQFKWRPNEASDAEPGGGTDTGAEAYFCPCCHEPAPPDAWWTKEQLAYARQLAAAEVLGPQLRDLQDTIEGINRSGGFLRIETELTAPGRPVALTEADDMVRIDLPCHPEEPLKVDDAWDGEVACLVCGIHYPVDLVRALPDKEEER